MRRVDEDLSGQTFTDARESYFLRCNLEGTIFLGDWRGSDYIGCTGGADWTGAQVYASYWRGGDFQEGGTFPSDIGYLHHDPVAEIIRVGAEAFPATIRKAMLAAAEFVRGNYLGGSWKPGARIAIPALSGPGLDSTAGRKFTDAWKELFVPYPNLGRSFERLVSNITSDNLGFQDGGLTSTISWPDGAEVSVDAMTDLSRYELARWIEKQADVQKPGPHYAFVLSIVPLILWALPTPDWWLTHPRGGF